MTTRTELNPTQQTVLTTLQNYGTFGVTTTVIAANTNIPVPSVRRTIRELLQRGYDIVREGRQRTLRTATA